MQKCSDEDEHFSEHFFQLWNEVANTQKIAGWYKVYIRGNSEPNEKQKKRAVRFGLRNSVLKYVCTTLQHMTLPVCIIWYLFYTVLCQLKKSNMVYDVSSMVGGVRIPSYRHVVIGR
jgi:hypothetical protein